MGVAEMTQGLGALALPENLDLGPNAYMVPNNCP